MTEYSNPRLHAEIPNWPLGGNKRGIAIFHVETIKGMQRACRTTNGATKKLTYAQMVRIVDGDDGKTYIAEFSGNYSFISIRRGDMKHQHETIWPNDIGIERNTRFKTVMRLFD